MSMSASDSTDRVGGWLLPLMVATGDVPPGKDLVYRYGTLYWDGSAKRQEELEQVLGLAARAWRAEQRVALLERQLQQGQGLQQGQELPQGQGQQEQGQERQQGQREQQRHAIDGQQQQARSCVAAADRAMATAQTVVAATVAGSPAPLALECAPEPVINAVTSSWSRLAIKMCSGRSTPDPLEPSVEPCVEAESEAEPEVESAAEAASEDGVEIEAEAGAGLEPHSPRRLPPLHQAIVAGCSAEDVQWHCRAAGAGDGHAVRAIHAVDSHGRTPLHIAVIVGNAAAVSELLRMYSKVGAGEALEARDARGRTPLELARELQQWCAVALLSTYSQVFGQRDQPWQG